MSKGTRVGLVEAVGRIRGETGQVLIVLVLAVPVVLGMAAIVVDFGNVFVQKRTLQQSADAAALAAAQRLTGGPCPSGGDPNCATEVATLAGDYQGAKNQIGASADPLPACVTPDDSNCYRLLPTSAAPDRVEVILTKNVPNFFGGILGKSSFDIRARAVAARFGYTSTTPGSTITTPGTTTPGTTTPGTPGTPALIFAKSTICTNSQEALEVSGAGSTFSGALVSNGGVNVANNITGDELIWGLNATSSNPNCIRYPNNWGGGAHGATKIYDWPVPLPVCTPACDLATAASKTIVTTVTAGGVTKPCTEKGDTNGDWDVPNAPLAPGLYCARNSIKINGIPPAGFLNVGFIAPSISWVGAGEITGYTGVNPLSQPPPVTLGLAFFAYGTGGVDASGSGKAFAGAIFAPFGPASLTGSGSSSACPVPGESCGFFEADTFRLDGANQHWQGLGPGFGGTDEIIIPGETTPGSTITNEDVVTTVGTGSNLDE